MRKNMDLAERRKGRGGMRQIKFTKTCHELKTWHDYFEMMWRGDKTFELRRNDRDYKVGDLLLLREYDEKAGAYMPRSMLMHVTCVVKDVPAFGLQDGFCIMSVVEISRDGGGCANVTRGCPRCGGTGFISKPLPAPPSEGV